MTPNQWRPAGRLFCPRHHFPGTPTMLTRRRALAILGAAGIGTGVFQRALAAKAAEGPITPQMVADAEWVAGIKLTPTQREAAANHLNKYRQSTKRVRAIELDNAQRPGLVFTPLTSPASQPDPRGYQVVAPPTPVSRAGTPQLRRGPGVRFDPTPRVLVTQPKDFIRRTDEALPCPSAPLRPVAQMRRDIHGRGRAPTGEAS